MNETLANLLVLLLGAYAAVGLLVGGALALRGIDRLDPDARAGSWGFRLLVWPGLAALWPWMVRSWLRSDGRPREERSAHRLAASDDASRRPR